MFTKKGCYMENWVDAKTTRETEGKKQHSLAKQLKKMIKEAQNSGHYATQMPAFFLLTFLKFTPAHERVKGVDAQGNPILANHRLHYQIRAAMPLPFWGTNLYIVASGEEKHECLWSLPQLARNSPLYTYQRSVAAGRPKFETDSILRMINGDLEAMTMEYNLDGKLEALTTKLVKSGAIPLLKSDSFAPAKELYC